jgi:hypothetical protein
VKKEDFPSANPGGTKSANSGRSEHTSQLIPAGTGYVATEWEREYTKDHGHEYFAKTVNDEMIEEFQPETQTETQTEILPEEPPVV